MPARTTSPTPTTYTNQVVLVNKSLTIDGPNWNTPYSGSDTDASVNSSTQAVFENGAGFLVEAGHVTIQGLTFDANNANNGTPDCFAGTTSYACSNSIDVQTNVEQRRPRRSGRVQRHDRRQPLRRHRWLQLPERRRPLRLRTRRPGVVRHHRSTPVTSSKTTSSTRPPQYQNNAVQISDTNGAVVDSNTVNYPTDVAGDTDVEISALWFPGFDQATQVEFNTLNGGGLDSDLSTGISTTDPKSGIKFVDEDANGNYGDGCTGQVISNNTISGFVSGITMESEGYNADSQSLCSDRTIRLHHQQQHDLRLQALRDLPHRVEKLDDQRELRRRPPTPRVTARSATRSVTTTTTTTTSQPISNTWTGNDGTGSAYPSSISDTNPSTTTTTVAPTTTTVAPTTTTLDNHHGGTDDYDRRTYDDDRCPDNHDGGPDNHNRGTDHHDRRSDDDDCCADHHNGGAYDHNGGADNYDRRVDHDFGQRRQRLRRSLRQSRQRRQRRRPTTTTTMAAPPPR